MLASDFATSLEEPRLGTFKQSLRPSCFKNVINTPLYGACQSYDFLNGKNGVVSNS